MLCCADGAQMIANGVLACLRLIKGGNEAIPQMSNGLELPDEEWRETAPAALGFKPGLALGRTARGHAEKQLFRLNCGVGAARSGPQLAGARVQQMGLRVARGARKQAELGDGGHGRQRSPQKPMVPTASGSHRGACLRRRLCAMRYGLVCAVLRRECSHTPFANGLELRQRRCGFKLGLGQMHRRARRMQGVARERSEAFYSRKR